MSGVDAGLFFLQRGYLVGDRLAVCTFEVGLKRLQRFARATEALELVQGGAGVAVEYCPLFCLPRSLAELIDVAGATAAEQLFQFTLRRLKFAFAPFQLAISGLQLRFGVAQAADAFLNFLMQLDEPVSRRDYRALVVAVESNVVG